MVQAPSATRKRRSHPQPHVLGRGSRQTGVQRGAENTCKLSPALNAQGRGGRRRGDAGASCSRRWGLAEPEGSADGETHVASCSRHKGQPPRATHVSSASVAPPSPRSCGQGRGGSPGRVEREGARRTPPALSVSQCAVGPCALLRRASPTVPVEPSPGRAQGVADGTYLARASSRHVLGGRAALLAGRAAITCGAARVSRRGDVISRPRADPAAPRRDLRGPQRSAATINVRMRPRCSSVGARKQSMDACGHVASPLQSRLTNGLSARHSRHDFNRRGHAGGHYTEEDRGQE